MAEELQGLLDKIYQEGVKKAEEEKARIIADAKKAADETVARAKTEAEELRKKADSDAAASEKRGKEAVRQAARDVILALKDDLHSRLDKVVRHCAGEAMTPDLMGKIILEIVKKSNDAGAGIELILGAADADKMSKYLGGSIVSELKSKPEIIADKETGAGLKIGFKGSDVFLDFSDNALSEMICKYAGPKLAEILMSK
jgi:V/A-type H+-transporting ATPase subunit E